MPDAELLAALRFVRAAREDETLRARLRALDPQQGLDPVLELARASGYEFGADALRRAHAHDWALRRVRYFPTVSG